MSRRFREEFYCTSCHKYFITYLRENFWGNYTIQCPNPKCNHQHYRVIKEGLVSEDRHNSTYETNQSELIVGLECTLRDTPWHDDPDFKKSQMRLIPGGACA